MTIWAMTAESILPPRMSPYAKSKWYLKSKVVQRPHPNLLERFLDFGKFKGLDIEQKATNSVILSSPKPQKKL